MLRGIKQAQAAVRAVLATAEGRSRGVTVNLRAGTYDDGPLRLGAVDSGRPGAPVTWRGEPGSLLSAGVEIPPSAWSLAPTSQNLVGGPTGAGVVWQAGAGLGFSTSALGGRPRQCARWARRGQRLRRALLCWRTATLARWPNKAADGSTVYAYTLGRVYGGPKVEVAAKVA